MKNKKMIKRFLSVMLSAALIGGMITVPEPQKAVAAEQPNSTIIKPDSVVSQDFENASDYDGKYLDDFSVSCGETENVTENVHQVFTADFEQAEDKTKVLTAPSEVWDIDTTEKKSGTGSLKLGFTSAWGQFGIGTFELKAGTEYTISYDWKIADYTQVDGTQNAYSRLVNTSLGIYANTGAVLKMSDFQKSETDWTTVTYSYTPTEDITAAAIYMEVGGGTATMWVDNLSVSYKTPESDVVELTMGFDKVEANDKWYLTSPDIAKVTAKYYKMSVRIDGKTVEIPVEKTNDGFVIWGNFFPMIDNFCSAPAEKFQIWPDTVMEEINPDVTGWRTAVEGGQTLKVTEGLTVGCINGVWAEQEAEYEKTASDVTISKLGTASFDADAKVWKLYTIPKNPEKVPGTEGVTTFHNVKIEVDGTECEGTYQRADDANGLCLTISSDILPEDGAWVKIKAGQYTSSDDTEKIKITADYQLYFYQNAVYQYEGDICWETDNGDYVVAPAENYDSNTVKVDGVLVEANGTYSKRGDHVMTYTSNEVLCAKRLMIYKLGDVNGDDSISLHDLVAMKKYIQTEQTGYKVSGAGEKAADMNIDTKVTDDDVKLLRQYRCKSTGVLALSPVYGQTAASANETAEAVITNYERGISEQYKTGGDIYFRNAAMLKWISFVEDAKEYIVTLAKKADMSDAVTYKTTECTLAIENLLADQDYYWTVQTGEAVSDIQTFHTQKTIRTLTVDGVSNTRDCGGYTGLGSKTVKQGMFYRGAELNNITEAGIAAMEQLAIKTDLDLRNSDETGGKGSPLGNSVNYVNCSGPYYVGENGIDNDAYKEALVNEIRTFTKEENYPIYVHCSLGRDRTGTICFLINALLGVSEMDLYLDYEFSMLSAVGSPQSAATMNGNFKRMYEYVMTFAPNEGSTIAEATEAFMTSIGITDAEITAIRNLLLE